MVRRCSSTLFRAKRVWLKPPMSPAQKAVKLSAPNMPQIDEITPTDDEVALEAVEALADEALALEVTTRTAIKANRKP